MYKLLRYAFLLSIINHSTVFAMESGLETTNFGSKTHSTILQQKCDYMVKYNEKN